MAKRKHTYARAARKKRAAKRAKKAFLLEQNAGEPTAEAKPAPKAKKQED